MTTTYLGSLSVGVMCPAALTLSAQLALRLGELNELYAELTAKIGNITANLDLIANVEIPNPIAIAAGLTAALGAVGEIAVQFPAATVNIGASLQADLDAVLALQVAIGVKIDAILALQAEINGALAGAGIVAYSYSGRADAMGGEIAGTLSGGIPGGSGPAQSVSGLVLACGSSADWAALGTCVKVA